MESKEKWGPPFFTPPEHFGLIRDYIFKWGQEKKIWTPDYFIKMAIEEKLMRDGYAPQVQELRMARAERRGVKPINMDYLDDKQRQTVVILMKHRNMPEDRAIKWVLEHEEEVGKVFR